MDNIQFMEKVEDGYKVLGASEVAKMKVRHILEHDLVFKVILSPKKTLYFCSFEQTRLELKGKGRKTEEMLIFFNRYQDILRLHGMKKEDNILDFDLSHLNAVSSALNVFGPETKIVYEEKKEKVLTNNNSSSTKSLLDKIREKLNAANQSQ